MKRRLLLMSALILLLPGCMCQVYKRPGGPFSFTAGLLMNEEMKRLTIDHTLRTNLTGYSAQGFSATVDDAAVSAITEGVVKGVMKGIVPIP